MRALTRLQASVIDSMLADEPGTQRERIRKSGLAPRTYQMGRGRALEAGWVAERLVPDPVLFGKPKVTLAIGRLAEPGDPEPSARWSALPGAALVWATPRTLIGVFFRADRPGPSPVAPELERSGVYAKSRTIELDLHYPALPVYFDFEAEWTQVSGILGVSAYPRPLPRRRRTGGGRGPVPMSPRWRHLVEELVRSEGAAAGPTPEGLWSGWSLRSAAPRALASGWIDRRAFLNPAQLPPYNEWSLEQIVFVTGRLRAERRPEVLLRTLIVGCQVHPFLFATNGADLWLATLSPPPPADAANSSPRRVSVGGTLARYLDNVEVLRETTSDLQAVVNHRYDRVIDGSPRRGATVAPVVVEPVSA